MFHRSFLRGSMAIRISRPTMPFGRIRIQFVLIEHMDRGFTEEQTIIDTESHSFIYPCLIHFHNDVICIWVD
jgi:hypothetical protein